MWNHITACHCLIDIKILLYKEATEPRVPFGKVEVITSKMTWLTAMDYLCHK